MGGGAYIRLGLNKQNKKNVLERRDCLTINFHKNLNFENRNTTLIGESHFYRSTLIRGGEWS